MFWPSDGNDDSQEPRRIRQNKAEHAEEIGLWAIVRDLRQAFQGVQLTAYQEQEIGVAVADAFKAGRELEKRLAKERDSSMAGVSFGWPFL